MQTVETALELSPENLPDDIQPAGMDLKRRWYLYEEICPLCMSSADVDLTCRRPSQPKPGSESQGDVAESTTGRKRKQTCSHCHQEGHTKTKRGKLTCPVLVSINCSFSVHTCTFKVTIVQQTIIVFPENHRLYKRKVSRVTWMAKTQF